MTTTLTFRLDAGQRKKLRKKAAFFGKSESEFLREILDRELGERPMSAAIGHLKGTLSSKGVKLEGWRQAIRDRNWRS
jgi:plasmid stability protein